MYARGVLTVDAYQDCATPVAAHTHDSMQLVFLFRGQAQVHAAQEHWQLQQGEAALFWPGCEHDFAPKAEVDFYSVHCAAPTWEAAVGDSVAKPAARMRHLVDAEQPLVHLLKALARTCPADPSYPLQTLEARWLRALREAALLSMARWAASMQGPRAPRVPYVTDAAQILARDLRETPDLEQLARQVGTSPRNLTRAFRRHLGLTPLQYTTNLRVEEAARLLRETDEAVQSIAWQVGFQSPPHFHRVFRRALGATPKAYRSRVRQGG